jgi:hypothetical protein
MDIEALENTTFAAIVEKNPKGSQAWRTLREHSGGF